MYIEKNIPLILDSTHAASKSSGSMMVRFEPMIDIPPEAMNVEIGLVHATVYNSFVNLTGTNEFKFTVNHAGISATMKTISIPAGAWSIDTLNEYIARFCEADGDCPDTLFALELNPSTRMVSIQTDPTMTSPSLTLTAVTIEFAEANMAGLAALLGFAAVDIAYGSFASGVSMVVAYGTTASTIHETVATLQMRSDLASGGVDPFGNSSTLLAAFPMTVSPGARMNYAPPVVVWHELSAANGHFGSAFFQLTDGGGTEVDTNGREYQLVLEIRYRIWLESPSDPHSQLVGSGYGNR